MNIPPEIKVRGRQTSDDRDRGWFIPGIHRINHGSYVICHDDDITLYKAQAVYSAYPSKPKFITRTYITLSL